MFFVWKNPKPSNPSKKGKIRLTKSPQGLQAHTTLENRVAPQNYTYYRRNTMQIFGKKISSTMGSMKLERDIQELETKKQTLVMSVNNEIGTLKGHITAKFTEIGAESYNLHVRGEFSEEYFAEKFAEITTLEQTIKEREAKIAEISGRYNEEITLLKNLTPDIAPAPVAALGRCTACNAVRIEGDAFCRGCGSRF
ncbi:MAG: hypothetical protein FWG68_06845 [Defluviitaleaceae bacterium]|nr:hypothetical protein [Defluviitaleaceae bacterium]